MSDPITVTKSGDVLRDEKGIYAICVMCKGRINMDCDKESGDMFGTCKNCGCHLDADKEGIWGVNLLENKNSANEEEE